MKTAEIIRGELKKLGITSRDVSVRAKKNGVDISIKNFKIKPSILKKLADEHEHIRYCEYTNEILSGGNFFVSVSYDWQAEKAEKEKPEYKVLREEIQTIFYTLKPDGSGKTIKDTSIIFKDHNGCASLNRHDKWVKSVHSVDEIAFNEYIYRITGE